MESTRTFQLPRGKTNFYVPIRQKVELLRECEGGDCKSRLSLNLVPDCLDVYERRGDIIKVENMRFNRHSRSFIRAFSFLFYLVHLLEKGDTGDFSCSREEMRVMVQGEADPILKKLGAIRPDSDYNYTLRSLILGYDICGREKIDRGLGIDTFNAGYRLAGNLLTSVVERPAYMVEEI